MTLLSAFGGGLWFIPTALILVSIYCFLRAVKQSKSGSLVGEASIESDKNVSLWKCPAMYAVYILVPVTIAIIIIMLNEA